MQQGFAPLVALLAALLVSRWSLRWSLRWRTRAATSTGFLVVSASLARRFASTSTGAAKINATGMANRRLTRRRARLFAAAGGEIAEFLLSAFRNPRDHVA
jgi:hypothetical protein